MMNIRFKLCWLAVCAMIGLVLSSVTWQFPTWSIWVGMLVAMLVPFLIDWGRSLKWQPRSSSQGYRAATRSPYERSEMRDSIVNLMSLIKFRVVVLVALASGGLFFCYLLLILPAAMLVASSAAIFFAIVIGATFAVSAVLAVMKLVLRGTSEELADLPSPSGMVTSSPGSPGARPHPASMQDMADDPSIDIMEEDGSHEMECAGDGGRIAASSQQAGGPSADTKFISMRKRDAARDGKYDPRKGSKGWQVSEARGNIASSLFADAAARKASQRITDAGARKASPKIIDPGVLDVTMAGYPTRLTNAAVSSRIKRGIQVTVTCSMCDAGPGDIEEIFLVTESTSRELSKLFRVPIAGMCKACLDKHGIRIVEDSLPRDPDAIRRFLRDHDRAFTFTELADQLGARSDQAKRVLSAHLSTLESSRDAREEGGRFIFSRSGFRLHLEGKDVTCPECGALCAETIIGLGDDTRLVLGRSRNITFPDMICEACATSFKVEVRGEMKFYRWGKQQPGKNTRPT